MCDSGKACSLMLYGIVSDKCTASSGSSNPRKHEFQQARCRKQVLAPSSGRLGPVEFVF
jgi:hypothetical protein